MKLILMLAASLILVNCASAPKMQEPGQLRAPANMYLSELKQVKIGVENAREVKALKKGTLAIDLKDCNNETMRPAKATTGPSKGDYCVLRFKNIYLFNEAFYAANDGMLQLQKDHVSFAFPHNATTDAERRAYVAAWIEGSNQMTGNSKLSLVEDKLMVNNVVFIEL